MYRISLFHQIKIKNISCNGEMKGDPTVLSLINKIAEQAKEIGRLEQALEDAKRKKGSPAYDAHTEAIADAG